MGKVIDIGSFREQKEQEFLSQSAENLFSIALMEEERFRPDVATAYYQKALEINPGYCEAHLNLGLLFQRSNVWRKAKKHFLAAIRADKNYALAHFALANLFDSRGNLDKAIAEYKIALRIVPDYADAHYNLALSYERKKKGRRALPHWRRYIQFDCEGPYYVYALGQIEKIMSGEKLKIVSRSRRRQEVS